MKLRANPETRNQSPSAPKDTAVTASRESVDDDPSQSASEYCIPAPSRNSASAARETSEARAPDRAAPRSSARGPGRQRMFNGSPQA